MLRRPLRPIALLLVAGLLYSQDLYAFGPAASCPINPAFNASPRIHLPLETKEVRTFTYTKEGTSLGLDPRVSSLIGAPISSIVGGVGFDQAKTFGENSIIAIQNGLLRGATSLGIEYLTQKANLDPLLGSLTSRAITGAIEGLFQVANPHFDPTKPEGPNNKKVLSSNIFEGVFNAFKDSALNVARLGVSGNDPWSQAQYLQRVINFSDIIKQKGLAKAIEDSATQIFHEDAISSMLKSFSSVGAFIQDQVTNNKTKVVVKDGKNYNRVQLSNGDWVDLDAGKLNIDEFKIGNQTERGTFGVDAYGNFGLLDGYRIGQLDVSHTVRHDIAQGNATGIRVYDLDGGVTFEIVPPSGQSFITYDSTGELKNFSINSYKNGSVAFEMSNGELVRYSSNKTTNDFDKLLPSELRDLPTFEVEKQLDGSYKTKVTQGRAIQQILLNAGKAFPGFAQAVTVATNPAMALATQVSQAQAEATKQALEGRYNLFKAAGYEDWAALGMATYYTVGDFAGYTPIAEAITGFDTVTGKDLSTLERAGKLGIGLLSAAGTAMSAVKAVEAVKLAPSFAAGIKSFTATMLGFNELLGQAGSVRIGSVGVSQIVDESAGRLIGFKSIPANQLPVLYDPKFNLSTKTLYSAQSKLALEIGDQFYGGKYFIHAAEDINPAISNPLTSNPTAIFNQYLDALGSGNMNATRILQTKDAILEGTRKNFTMGLITQAQRDAIFARLNSATIQDFSPRMLKIDGIDLDVTKVTGKLTDGFGNKSIEYVLRDTDKSLVKIIDQR